MYIPVTYEQDFDDLWMHLKSKYPEKLFNLDGVGEQLDMSKFSKKFFSSAVTSDASIDANANVDDMSVIAYEKELPKPFLKMNSYYILWKELKKLYGRPFADSVVEMQLTGDIYINDMHGIGAGKPYSYFGDTQVVISDKEWPFVTLCDLWNQYAEQMPVTDHGDYEEIIPEDLKVLDADDAYVHVSRIVRHKNTQPLLVITVGDAGEPQFQLKVTADHPIILENGSELPAEQLKVGDVLAMSQRFRNYILDKQKSDLKIYDNVNIVSSISPMPELDPKDFGDKAIYVYDITTETGTFAADGIFKAHNCFNYSTYDILTKGLPMVKKVKCEPPKYLYSFKSQLEQFVTIASNSTLGASGTADMLIMMAYYVKNMLNTLSDAHFTFADEDAVWRYVHENLVSFVYTINQPMRGNQCVTEDTEVLTPGGWKKYDELHVGDDIYTWHDNELRIQQVQRVNVNDYDGEMHRYRGERFDMQVTPNHRVLYTTDPPAKEFDLKPSQEIIECEDVYIPVAARKWEGTGGIWPQVGTSELHNRDVVCPLGFFNLYQTYLPYCVSRKEAATVVRLSKRFEVTKNMADELQHLCVLAGWDSTATKLDNGRYTVEVRQHISTLDRADKKEIVHYQGKVWCPTTEDGVVVFRHNGTVFISGNSPFTNLSVYDDNFLDKLCADYIFPDGSTPDKEIVKKLQNIYLDIMNEELQRTPLTFPVTTACFSIDKNNSIQDEAFLHNIAQKNLQWGFINMYAGSSSTLSSCCFDGSQPVFYMEDPEDGAWRTESLSRLYELYHDAVLFTMGAHGEKSMCKVIRIAGQPIYKLYLEGIKEPIPTSETHLNPVVGYGLVPSYKLAPGDKLISRGEDGEGAEVAITSISIEPAPEYVYCLEMITAPQEEALFTLPNGIITHNCRLRSEQQSEYFNSFGSGSSKIGSLGVCTINFPRLAIQYPLEEDFMEKLEEMVGVCAKVNNAKRHIVQKRINNGNEPLYKYEFMELSKQYSTCGVNGFYETIQLLGYDILTEEGQALALRILDKINDTNKIYQNKYKMPHNVEQVPGENLSIKLAEKDKLMGYQNEYNLYSNQFIPLIANADLFDRIKLQGLFDSHFSGGSICHLNVETQITDVKDMEDLIRVAAKKGVVYFAINYVLSQCTNEHMSVTNGDKCLVCGEPITDKYSRVVGFLTNIKNWHKVRREEDFPNRQFYQGEEIAPPEEEIEKVDLARNVKE